MHRALYIDEVLRIAFLDLTTRDLYHVALTCKTFLEPALDDMWYTLNGPNDLFRLWPHDALDNQGLPYEEPTSPFETKFPSLIRPLLPTEWDRFNFYARRVRELHIGNCYPASPLAIPNLRLSIAARSDQPTPLLPNLTDVILGGKGEDPYTFDIATPLLSPTLSSLSIQTECRSPCTGLTKFLRAVREEIRPRLTELAVETLGETISDPNFKDELSRLINSLSSSLGHVTLSNEIGWDTIEALGTMPQLEMLDYCSTAWTIKTGDRGLGVIGRNWFPALQILRTDARLALSILSSLESKGLIEEVENSLNLTTVTSPQIAQSVINLLGSASFPNLHSYSFTSNIDRHYDRDLRVLSFSPLRYCTKIRTFHVAAMWTYLAPPTDTEYALLARSWPDLQYLKFATKEPERATLKTLEVLSRHCPELEVIDIGLDLELYGSLTFGTLQNLSKLRINTRAGSRDPRVAMLFAELRGGPTSQV